MRTFPVGVGAAASPTPTGRFAVAEKLDGARYRPVRGCCILGLTAHQPQPPSSWSPGRDYLVAIHGGAWVGTAVSAGCLHLDDESLRYLNAGHRQQTHETPTHSGSELHIFCRRFARL